MRNKSLSNKKVYVGWDIGGANTKIVVLDENLNFIYSNKFYLPIWESFSQIKETISYCLASIHKYDLFHLVTFTAESCDNFDNRSVAIKSLARICHKLLGKNLKFYSNKNKYENFKHVINNPLTFASSNWVPYRSFLIKKYKYDIAIDLGSTTTDIIPNKTFIKIGSSDFERINMGTLLYFGVERTPLSMLLDNINVNKKKIHLLNEFYARSSDVFLLSKDLLGCDVLSKNCDGRSNSLDNCRKRLLRQFGLDLNQKNFGLSNRIVKAIKNDIIENIDSLVKQHVKKNDTVKIFGTGQGEFLLKELCKKKKYIFYSSSNMLEANYPIKKSKLIKDNFTAYLVIRNFLNK